MGSRLTVAAALTFGPICLVWAGSGPWQIDMTFFVVFAALVAYVDWRPIALSAALTASHHPILDLVARDVIFPEERNAEFAMYRARADGNGRYQLFWPELAQGAARRLDVEMALRTALERGELSVHYQVIVALDDRRPAGFEARLRWHHPDLGALLPSSSSRSPKRPA